MWLRCVECAMKRLRILLSDGRVTVGKTAHRFGRGDRVRVRTEGIDACGVVVRSRNESYTVELDRGGRCYATRTQLSPA